MGKYSAKIWFTIIAVAPIILMILLLLSNWQIMFSLDIFFMLILIPFGLLSFPAFVVFYCLMELTQRITLSTLYRKLVNVLIATTIAYLTVELMFFYDDVAESLFRIKVHSAYQIATIFAIFFYDCKRTPEEEFTKHVNK